jgi:hypothetical protein
VLGDVGHGNDQQRARNVDTPGVLSLQEERDRFRSFQFWAPTLVPGVQHYSPERVAKPRQL